MSDNDAGLSIIYKGGYVSDLAICIDPTDRFYGWLLARNPLDGRWVSLTKIGANATTLYGARNRIAELEAALAERTKERDEAIRRAEKAERQLDQLLTAAKEAVSWHEIERATAAIDAARAGEK